MRGLYLFVSIALMIPANGQAQNNDASQPVQAPSVQLEDSLPNPAVLLKPVQQKSGFNLSLIDDVCKQNKRQTTAYQLQHAAVDDVAVTINQWLQQKLKSKKVKVDGFICNAPIIIVPQTKSNTLVVSTTDAFAYGDELEKMVRELDKAPQLVRIHAVIKKTVNGQTTVISRPTMVVVENTTGRVTVDSQGEQLTLELTPRVVENPSELTERAAENASAAENRYARPSFKR